MNLFVDVSVCLLDFYKTAKQLRGKARCLYLSSPSSVCPSCLHSPTDRRSEPWSPSAPSLWQVAPPSSLQRDKEREVNGDNMNTMMHSVVKSMWTPLTAYNLSSWFCSVGQSTVELSQPAHKWRNRQRNDSSWACCGIHDFTNLAKCSSSYLLTRTLCIFNQTET